MKALLIRPIKFDNIKTKYLVEAEIDCVTALCIVKDTLVIECKGDTSLHQTSLNLKDYPNGTYLEVRYDE